MFESQYGSQKNGIEILSFPMSTTLWIVALQRPQLIRAEDKMRYEVEKLIYVCEDIKSKEVWKEKRINKLSYVGELNVNPRH